MGNYMTNLVDFNGCIDKFKFVFWSLPQEEGKERKKKFAEQCGDKGLYPITTAIPGTAQAIWQLCTAPKVIVVTAGLIGVCGLSYLRFPDTFIWVAGEAIKNMPDTSGIITAERIKTAGYAWGVETILSLTARAYGRFSSQSCVNKHWHGGKAEKPALPAKNPITS